MGNKSSKGRCTLEITNVNPKVKAELKAVAKYRGETVSYMLRPLLRSLLDKYPTEQRRNLD
jgi:hypothetical protein